MPSGFWMDGWKEEKDGFMHIIKYIPISRFSLRISVSISDIFVAPKKEYPIQPQFTETLSFCKFGLNLYCISDFC